MIQALIELLKIKSIITLVVVFLFAVLSFRGVISSENSFAVILMVLTYYFNKDSGRPA